ncbi:MAG: hypothetical protein ACJA0M_002302 [Chitinophagales bacterium]|jgi:hypothetical protein
MLGHIWIALLAVQAFSGTLVTAPEQCRKMSYSKVKCLKIGY